MALNERLDKFKQQQERCQTTLSSIAATQASILKPKVSPVIRPANAPFSRIKPPQTVKFSDDTERLQHMNSIRKSAVGAQIKLVITLLDKTRRPFTAEQISEATYVDIHGNKAVFDGLRNNPKVKFDGRHFFYKPTHDLTGGDQLLNLIKKCKDGIAVEEVKDAYPSVLEDLQALKASGNVFWLSGTNSQEDTAYFNKPRCRITAAALVLILLPLFFSTAAATNTTMEVCDASGLASHILQHCGAVQHSIKCCDTLVWAVDEEGGGWCLCGAAAEMVKMGAPTTYANLFGIYDHCGGLNVEVIRHHSCSDDDTEASPPPTKDKPSVTVPKKGPTKDEPSVRKKGPTATQERLSRVGHVVLYLLIAILSLVLVYVFCLAAIAVAGWISYTCRWICAHVRDNVETTPMMNERQAAEHDVLAGLTPAVSDWSVNGIINYIKLRKKKAEEYEASQKMEKYLKEQGWECFMLKDYNNASLFYSEAISIDPYDAKLFSDRSLAWLCLGDGRKAMQDALQCKQLQPKWASGYFRHGQALLLLKEYEKACNELAKAIELDPQSTEIINLYRDAMDLRISNNQEEEV